MPLLDHFHPPLSDRRHWHSFHNSWATYLSSALNARLPEGYFAEANVQFGVEVDVAAFEEAGASAVGGWTPPPPQASVPVTLQPAVVEVGIFSRAGGPTLAGAVELVSPANKDRPATRDAFVLRCASLLQQAIGLAVVNIVTDRTADLHTALLHRLSDAVDTPPSPNLWAASYRPWQVTDQTRLEIWHASLALGSPLPSSRRGRVRPSGA